MQFMGLMIPFLGTTLGAAAVFPMRNTMKPSAQILLERLAAGVMTAASVWSLLLPALAMTEEGLGKGVPAASGFLAGIIILFIINHVIRIDKKKKGSTRNLMTAIAVTLHNIPEGMAVGISLAAALNDRSPVTAAAAAALSFGIAVQNVPEGAIISLPLKSSGTSKGKAFLIGMLSGAVEPIAGGLTILLTGMIAAALPYLLSFAAGAMLYVVTEELLTETHGIKNAGIGVAGFTAGFLLMMLLDVYFG